MSDKHGAAELTAIESVLTGLDELNVVLGPQISPKLGEIRQALVRAMAARDRGDKPGAVAAIAEAMDALTGLADDLDPAEGAMMHAVAEGFRAALLRGDYADAKRAAGIMMRQSGALERKKD